MTPKFKLNKYKFHPKGTKYTYTTLATNKKIAIKIIHELHQHLSKTYITLNTHKIIIP